MSRPAAPWSHDRPRSVALVTGAGRGLGAAMSSQLACDGLHVAVADLDIDNARTVAETVTAKTGAEAVALEIDVTSRPAVDSAVQRVHEAFGRLDVLVNNAGIIARQAAEAFDERSWQAHLEVHLSGAMHCSQAAFSLLCDSGRGAIVNVASVGATFGLPGRLAYTTAKTGILGLTRALAAEWGRHQITVNAVAPGYMDSTMTHTGLQEGVLDREVLLSRIPLERLGAAEDVAFAVSFLASPRARYISGAVLPIDGGITIDGTFDAAARRRVVRG